MNESTSDGIGYLIVRASTALGAIPVPDATVTVRNGSDDTSSKRGGILYVLNTDKDGKTPRVALAAPPRSVGLSPSAAPAYATYNIDVQADGFYRLYFHQVPVYEGITSLQPAFLVPVAENGSPDGLSYDEIHLDGGMNPNLRPLGADEEV